METAFDTLLKRLLTEDLSKSTIVDLASQSKDKQLLVEDLLLASYGKLFNGMKEAAGGIRREGITYLDPVGSAKREPIPSYMLHYGTKDWKPIERIKEAAKIICDEYGLDWMEADPPTLQELETKRDGISKDLELVLKKLPGYIPGQIKPEDYYKWLQEITDKAKEVALAKGLTEEAAQAVVPIELEAECLAQSLAEITAEIEQARQQEAERAAEPGTDPEQEAEEKRSANDQFSTNKSTEEIEKIFNNLKDAGFIDKQTLLAQWRAVCGFTKRGDTQKINWIGKQVELVNFVSELWVKNNQNNPDHWERTANCFLVNGSEQKAKNLSSSFQKPESKKNRVDLLKSIIKGTYTSSK